MSNPWAVHSETSFTSAIKQKETRPEMRRRGSDAPTRRTRGDYDPQSGMHIRSRTTDDGTYGHASVHPLSPATGSMLGLKRNSNSFSPHDTRPHLKKLLDDEENTSATSEWRDDCTAGEETRSSARREEKVVLIHEVMPNDSLAGVALNYGISLPDLRRANQLWPSDTIHLRKVLYIPLEKARRSSRFRVATLDIDAQSSVIDNDGESAEPRDSSTSNARSKVTILRVPASQLSFFPPPSSIQNDSHIVSKSQTLPRLSHGATSHQPFPGLFTEDGSSSRPSPLSPSSSVSLHTSTPSSRYIHMRDGYLASFFTSTPIRASISVRNTIFGRPSTDSTSATASTQSDDLEWSHEMEDVGIPSSAGKISQGDDPQSRRSAFLPRPSSPAVIRTRGADIIEGAVEMAAVPSLPLGSRTLRQREGRTSNRTLDASASTTTHVRNTTYAADERVHPAPVPLRTAQLEPSPMMQLPLPARKSKPQAS
ncbi:carbohydrate-binding module family 50 protein [Laetiporus sulphureus 93-53]|uniref:Carbohydrate-binding module family 50 protein n=1 Tax=Laetiporus sulphureus 93-53 TaxID=1314785 RepID=A0A165GW23_9APHY|nr:carbohydrate-binding module family 50 protein [Laetiporus sulphureus 93-53]KZT10904.1 carbohydrate-binding module family 50 protein [Laetiporus sulphureus 93-53]